MSVRETIRRALATRSLPRPTRAATAPAQAVAVIPAAAAAGELPAGVPGDGPGHFVTRSFANPAGARNYKVYVPQSYGREGTALIVMLHGCTQTPDDFAAGTRMNELADLHGFLVAYPAQLATANGAKCWNWFNGRNQLRDCGEPSLIAGIATHVAAEFRVDPRRIFVAGLSAGAAMAVILAATYPELFAAVGVHSGLPYGAAHDASSAFAAMRGSTVPAAAGDCAVEPGDGPLAAALGTVRAIVFHGDSDRTVHAVNGSQIVAQAISAAAAEHGPLRKTVQARTAANGLDYTTTTYLGAEGKPVIEHWELHGADHAWSGGSAAGSFTDARGPDASAEMVRFFLGRRTAPGRKNA